MAKTISNWTQIWMDKKQIPFCFLDLATSSNDLAKEYAFTSSEPTMVFLVSQQKKGRGYGNKKWENSDLMLSFLWQKCLKELHSLSCKDFAFDVLQALKLTWPQLEPQLKIPNDIYLNKKKVAGLLLEILNQGSKTALIVGLGLNVFSCSKKVKGTYLENYIKPIYFQQWEFFLEKMVSFWFKRAVYNE